MFSLVPRGLEGTDNSNEDGSASVNHKKMLIIGGTTLGALVTLGGIGGIIWYSTRSPVNQEYVGKMPDNVDGGGGVIQQVFPILHRIVTTVTANFKLTVGVLISVFILITAIIALVVYRMTPDTLMVDPDAQAAEGGLTGEVAKEKDKGLPVLPISAAVVAVLLFAVFFGWRYYMRSPKTEKLEELNPHKVDDGGKLNTVFPETLADAGKDADKLFKILVNFRIEMPPESRCVKPKGEAMTAGKLHRVQVLVSQDPHQLVSVDCPEGFTLNSVWWAFQETDKLVWVIQDEFVLFEADLTTDNIVPFIWHQNQKLGNIPGTNGIPLYPQPLAEEADSANAFQNDFAAWHEWAIKDERCKLTAIDSTLLEPVSVELEGLGVASPVTIKCQSKQPTFRSVYSAVVKINGLEGKNLQIYLDQNRAYCARDLVAVEDKRNDVWLMYESFSPLNRAF